MNDSFSLLLILIIEEGSATYSSSFFLVKSIYEKNTKLLLKIMCIFTY